MINLPKLQQSHRRFLKAHQTMVETELEAAGQVGEDHPRQHATFKRRTGALQDATDHKVVRTRGGHLVRVFNPKKYARAIDSGARPHLIVAKRAQFLRFRGGDGKFVFRRSVRHPGNKPYKFLYRAISAAYRVAGPNLETGMARIAKNF